MSGFTGTTQVCLKDFFGRYQWEAIRLFVAKYAGVEKPSVLRWKKGSLPKGTELLKIRVLLDTLGYHVSEFEVVPRPSRQFSRAIALGLITIDEAAETLGYASINSLQGLLLRNETPQSFKWHRLERWLANNTASLDAAIRAFQRELEGLPKERGFEPPLAASQSMASSSGVIVEQQPAVAPREPQPFVPIAPPADLSNPSRPMGRTLVYSLMALGDLLDAIELSPDKAKVVAQFFAIARPEEIEATLRKLNRLVTTG